MGIKASATQPVALRRVTRGVLYLAACVSALALWASGAQAAVAIESFALSTRHPLDGTVDSQAGAHADLNVSLLLKHPGEPETARELEVTAPPGVFANPEVVPRCPAATFDDFECTPDSQVGLITLRADYEGDAAFVLGTAPVFSLVPEPGEIARLGFVVPTLGVPIVVPVSVRSEMGYPLSLSIDDLPEAAPLAGLSLSLWATPAATYHDFQRFAPGTPGEPAGCPGREDTECAGAGAVSSSSAWASLRNPTACDGPLGSVLLVDSYQDPGDFASAMSSGAANSGCGALPFEPKLTASLTDGAARSASGLELTFDNSEVNALSPSGLSASDIKSIAATLPPELTVDRGVLEGGSVCTEVEFVSFGSGGGSGCDEGSRLGGFTAHVLGVEPPLEGSIYRGGSEFPGVYRLFLEATGQSMNARLVASLQPEAEEGKTRIAIPSLPEFPFAGLQLAFAESTGLFRTPRECGSYDVRSVLVPWSSPADEYVETDPLTVDSGPGDGPCPGPASAVAVSLAPLSIVADGTSTSLATATVSDANGYGLDGQEVVLRSSDPGERIGAVIDHGDGTYTASIKSSTTPGVATITAVDESVKPAVSGTVRLDQTAKQDSLSSVIASASDTPLSPRPIVAFRKRPDRHTRDRRPTFDFVASEPGSTFSCKLDRGRFHACRSPYKLPKLSPGPHVLRVRAVDATGLMSKTATYKFVVVGNRAT